MIAYRLVDDALPPLEAPVLIVALEGWVDAAAAATTAANHIARGGERVAVFDVDAIVDYRARRPMLDIVDGSIKNVSWPETAVTHVRSGARDLLVLTGPEPDTSWRAFSAGVLDFALRAGVTQHISLGAIPLAVPHTRPTPVLMTATPRDLLTPEDPRPEGLLRVPTAAVTAIEVTIADQGIPVVGFWAQTPHYLTSFFQASLALAERLRRHVGGDFDLDGLVQAAARERGQLDAIIAERPEVREHVEQLEAMTPEDITQRLPTGDEIASEIERYLRDRPE